MLGIAGESGCGKSTLALSLMGYYFPPLHDMSGDISIDGRNISGMNPDEVRKLILGREIAYIPQSAMNALNPTQKSIHFIEDVIQEHDLYVTKKDIYERAKKLFETLGLPPKVLDKYPVELLGGMKQRTVIAVCVLLLPKVLIADEPSSALDITSQKMVIKRLRQLFEELTNKYPFELSGGQMQRLMIAPIFLLKPKILLADEPTSMIDASSRATILDELMQLRNEIGMTIIFITHDIGLAYYVSDSVYIMEHGKLVESGSADDVILHPKEAYTRRLISDVPKIYEEWDLSTV